MADTKKAPAKKAAAKKAAAKKAAAKKTPAKKAAGSKPDAIALLKADHRRVSDLFDSFEKLGDRAHKSREATVARIIEELSVHAGIEEAVFYPAVRERAAATDRPMLLEALEEHHLVELTLAELESMSSEHERFTAKVTVLRELVDHHVKEEESDMFTQVRDLFSRAELVSLGDDLRAARPGVSTRPHPEAPDTPPGNIVANVLAAPLDAAAGVTTTAAKAIRNVVS